MKTILRLAGLACALVGSQAMAETGEEAAAVFGARQTVLGISLSPSGEKVAITMPFRDHGEQLVVYRLGSNDSSPKIVFRNEQPDTDIGDCKWATEVRLVCSAYILRRDTGLLIGFSRLFSASDQGGEVLLLTPDDSMRASGIRQNGGTIVAFDYPERPNRILITRQWVREVAGDSRTANTREGLGVELVDVESGDRTIVESPEIFARAYVADETGRVRLKIEQRQDTRGLLDEERLYYFRTADSDRWRPISKAGAASLTTSEFRPVAVDAAKDVIYGFGNNGGYDAVYSIALGEEAASRLVLGRDDVDVDSLIRIGRARRVVGASYATEKREIAYFDESVKSLAARLQQALPGNALVNFVDASEDESRLLVVVSSDTNPGMIYLYDKAAGQLSEVMPVRPELDGRVLAEMRPVSFPAADGTIIPGYLTLPAGEAKGLPAIVLPHGGPSARDEWGFDWLVQFFAARGYAVLQPNYRGSSGYGEAWFGRNGFQAWETAVGDVNDAGRWLIGEGIADPERLAIVGWSYGGYAALQSQVLDPALFRAVVAIAPVTDLDGLKEQARPYTNFEVVSRFVGTGPHLDAGSPAENAERFAAPVLLFHGTEDLNVAAQQSRLMANRLRNAGKPVDHVEYPDSDHQLDNSRIRREMLERIDRFLASHLDR